MRQQDIEKLGRLVGWHHINNGQIWVDNEDNIVARRRKWSVKHNCWEWCWNPFESWNDAGMVFEASGAASMALARAESKSAKAKVYVCVLIFDDTSTFHADSPDGYPAAIAEAALKVCDG